MIFYSVNVILLFNQVFIQVKDILKKEGMNAFGISFLIRTTILINYKMLSSDLRLEFLLF